MNKIYHKQTQFFLFVYYLLLPRIAELSGKIACPDTTYSD